MSYTLTINKTGPSSCTVTPSSGSSYAAGTVVTVTAQAATDYIFYRWSGDGTAGGSTTPDDVGDPQYKQWTVTMDSDITLSVVFAYVVGGYPSAKTAEQYGLYLDSSYLGGASPYYTTVFIKGPNGYGTTDYPVIRVRGDGITVSSILVDDDYFGFSTEMGQIFGVRGSVATFASISIEGDSQFFTYNRLINSIRYGIITWGCTNFYIGYNTIERSQYCISGSGAASSTGVIEYNRGEMVGYTVSIKAKGWQNVTVRYNYFDVTPVYSGIAGRGLNFSDDSPNNNSNVVFEYNTFERRYAGNYPTQDVVWMSYDANCALTGNIIRNNLFINLVGSDMTATSTCAGDNFTITGNTFYNSSAISNSGTGNTISNTFKTGRYSANKKITAMNNAFKFNRRALV